MYKYDANIKHCFNKTIDLLYYFKALLYFRMILNNKSMETTVKERLMKYLYKKDIKSNYFCAKNRGVRCIYFLYEKVYSTG